MTAINPRLAAAIAAKGVPLSADYAPQPSTPRWHQRRTELIRTLRPYMPETAASKAVDLVDEVIAELGGRTAGPIEYGIRIPEGDVLLDGDTTDRAEQEERLDRCRGKALWPDAVLVQRPVFHGEWTEATS
jgi:hypothetical protein